MEPNKFKVGDRVRRVVYPFKSVNVGDEHIVSEVLDGDSLRLQGLPDESFFSLYFELVTSAPPYPTGGVPRVMPQGAIGDVNSTAKGSGARFNSGKARLELIPLALIADIIGNFDGTSISHAVKALRHLGHWQEDGKDCHLKAALVCLGDDIWQECAGVFDYGRKKYAEWNWAKGMAWSVPTGCAARHLMAIINGEDTDPESGLSHRGHAACNLVMLLQYMKSFPEGDDRPRYLEPLNDPR